MGAKMRTLTHWFWLIVSIAFGSIIPDLDHILPPFKRSWGHTWAVPCLILFVVVAAYLGRLLKSRFLRGLKLCGRFSFNKTGCAKTVETL